VNLANHLAQIWDIKQNRKHLPAWVGRQMVRNMKPLLFAAYYSGN